MTITPELLRKLGDWRADKEGQALFEAGRVSDLDYTDHLLSGQVGNIRARLKLGDGPFGIENRCSCRQARVEGTICGHVVALVHAWLNKDKPRPAAPSAVPAPRTTSAADESFPPDAVFEHPVPAIRATLDGALGGLNLVIEAVYDGATYHLLGPLPARAEWEADPVDPLRYWQRHRATEQRALDTALEAGFVAGTQHHRLAGEPAVGRFLANILPGWQRDWDVRFGPRLTAFLARCEVIKPELTVRAADNNWLAVDLQFKGSAAASALGPTEVRQLLQKSLAHQRLTNGKIALVPTVAIEEFDAVVYDCAAQQTATGLRVPKRFGAYIAQAAQENRWQPPAVITPFREVALPDELARQLRPYQRAGVNWLAHLAENQLGGILADEMGLGKTVQTLGYLVARRRTDQPSLVVCPTSLLANWEAEAARFTPSLRTLVLHGSGRHEQFAALADHDLVITSYALLRRDAERYATRAFNTVILDEAQQIKNRFSQVAQAVKSLRAAHRFVLTGTPLENALTDLWSIMDFLMPGYLGPATEFRDRYETPITQRHDDAALRRLRQRLRPFLLRRTKREVTPELPPKLEQVTFCDLSAEQAEVYQSILAEGRRAAFEHAGKGGDAQGRMAVLVTLTRLRQACCHLGLLPGLGEKPWREPSAKLDTCLELLDEAISGEHRVLVFSQFTSLLQLVAVALQERGLAHCYLDGATTDRAGVVRRFQQDDSIPVFLISLKAGGTGLNLAGADTVIHLDPWWNPAVEEQATARAHRIGQQRMVTSYKLIARGSVEEKIVRLQERKKELVAGALTDEESFAGQLSWEELQGLLE